MAPPYILSNPGTFQRETIVENSSSKKIPATLIPGDGIGPEVVEVTVRDLDALGSPFDWDVHGYRQPDFVDAGRGDDADSCWPGKRRTAAARRRR